MHKLNEVNKVLKLLLFICFVVPALAACTGKDDIELELSGTGGFVEAGEQSFAAETDAGPEDIDADILPEKAETAVNETEVDITSQTAVNVGKIYVHICGAVVNPGVYELEEGSRVFEGVEAAGGFTEEAYTDYVNQAGKLKDEERIVIPTIEEIETAKAEGKYQDVWSSDVAAGTDMSGNGSTEATAGGSGLVNINTATESELGAISGIGAGKAAAIVKYRNENGSFASVEDIMKVSGIKEGTYEKIKDKITIN